MANISLSKETELNFKLNVEGAKEVPSVRFIMNFSEDYSVLISGTAANNIATVKIPKMPFLMESNVESIPAKLEVIVDGQYFMPWTDDLKIKKDVKVEAIVDKEESLREKTDIAVQLIESETIPSQEEIEETVEEEYIEEINNEVIEEKENILTKEKRHLKIDSLTLEEFLSSTMTSDDLFGEE